MEKVRQALRCLEEAFRCPHCNRQRLVRYTAWRGHGIGVHGASYYTPTAQEQISPQTHCICPGGPVWQELERMSIGSELRLREAYEIWRRRGSNPNEVVLFEGVQFVAVPFELWEKVVSEQWKALTQDRQQ